MTEEETPPKVSSNQMSVRRIHRLFGWQSRRSAKSESNPTEQPDEHENGGTAISLSLSLYRKASIRSRILDSHNKDDAEEINDHIPIDSSTPLSPNSQVRTSCYLSRHAPVYPCRLIDKCKSMKCQVHVPSVTVPVAVDISVPNRRA